MKDSTVNPAYIHSYARLLNEFTLVFFIVLAVGVSVTDVIHFPSVASHFPSVALSVCLCVCQPWM